mgnify:CR=1 FL=1
MVADDINKNAVLTDLALSQSRDILIRMSQHYKDIKFINASERGILHGGNIELKTIDEIFSYSIIKNVA